MEELTAWVTKLKQTATSPPTLAAKLSAESEEIKTKTPRADTKAAKRKALLDSI